MKKQGYEKAYQKRRRLLFTRLVCPVAYYFYMAGIIKKGMYVLSESGSPDDYYERSLRNMYIITDDEDLKIGLDDWLREYERGNSDTELLLLRR